MGWLFTTTFFEEDTAYGAIQAAGALSGEEVLHVASRREKNQDCENFKRTVFFLHTRNRKTGKEYAFILLVDFDKKGKEVGWKDISLEPSYFPPLSFLRSLPAELDCDGVVTRCKQAHEQLRRRRAKIRPGVKIALPGYQGSYEVLEPMGRRHLLRCLEDGLVYGAPRGYKGFAELLAA